MPDRVSRSLAASGLLWMLGAALVVLEIHGGSGVRAASAEAESQTVFVKVFEDSGLPVDGAPVVLRTASGRQERKRTTGDGSAYFVLLPGSYSLSVPDHPPRRFTVQDASLTLRFPDREPQTVFVKLFDDSGLPVDGAPVVLRTGSGKQERKRTTGDGSAYFPVLAGKYEASVTASGYDGVSFGVDTSQRTEMTVMLSSSDFALKGIDEPAPDEIPLASSFTKRYAVILGARNRRFDAPGETRILEEAVPKDLKRMRGYLESLERPRFEIVVEDPAVSGPGAFRQHLDYALAKVRRDDQLIVYFSGHGVEIDGRGFLVPTSGQPGKDSTLFPMDELRRFSRRAAQEKGLKSLGIIIDSCVAGLAGRSYVQPSASKGEPGRGATYLARALRRRHHVLLTAGDDEEEAIALPSGSIFTSELVDAMRSVSRSRNVIWGHNLIYHVSTSLSRRVLAEHPRSSGMTPQYYTLPGHESGELVIPP